jgi:GT2 family glycosyltransferase
VTPVVIVVYRRPAQTRALIDALRSVRPDHVIVVADGPRTGDERDAEAVARTRDELDRIDWPCRIDTHLADTNLGCTPRIRSGLDAVFADVERAIVLEDDVHPHPSLFAWMDRMLAVYADRDDVAMLCGHNPLIRWSAGRAGTGAAGGIAAGVADGAAAIPSRRGGVHGWATWARAWWAVRDVDVTGPLDTVDADVEALGLDPALAALSRRYLTEARTRPLSWDVDWTVRMLLSGRVALVSPVNLVHHDGVGPDATHHVDSDDTLFHLPRLEAPVPSAAEVRHVPVGAHDAAFDRARVLLELLVRARDPKAALRLARHPGLPLPAAERTHLLPFVHRDETLALVDHLEAEGLEAARAARWRSALGVGTGAVVGAAAVAGQRAAPDVAVVVATRDAAGTLATALDGIAVAFARAAPCVAEVVVIDGGTSEASRAATRGVVAGRPGVRWIAQEGTGLAAARNQGVALTSAPLVAFCDADDVWEPDGLRLRLDALDQPDGAAGIAVPGGAPGAWGATGRVRFVDRAGGEGGAAGDGDGGGRGSGGGAVRRRAGTEHAGATPGALLVRRDAFARVGPFDASLTVGADADWILRAEQALGPAVPVDAVVLEKGLRVGSLSTDVATYRGEMLTIARRFLADRARRRGREPQVPDGRDGW